MRCWLGLGPQDRNEKPPRSLLERGEAALLRGDLAAAEADLNAAILEDAADPWAYVYRAAQRYQAGRFDEASQDAAEFSRRRPDAAAGYAIKALLSAREGDRPKTQKYLDEAVARCGEAWAKGLRGTMLARWGQLDAARADLDAAVAYEPAPWVLAEHADVLNRLGLFWLALKDLDRMRVMLPGDPEADIRAASIHLDQAQYKDAASKLGRAIALRPGDAALWHRRAQVYLVKGDVRTALRDLERACELSPRDPALAVELVRAAILCDESARAEKLLTGAVIPEASRRHCLGYLRCRQGRYKESREHFAAAAADASVEPHLKAKAEFYGLVARTLEESPKPVPPPPGRELIIIGLGYRQPFQVTRQALAELRGCEKIYSNLSDSAVVDFVGLFPLPLQAIVFRRDDQEAIKCARDVMPGFKKHRRIAMVTRGHPLYYGRLAYRLTIKSRRRGSSVRCAPSVSISDVLPSMAAATLHGGAQGLQARDSSDLGGIDPRLPLVLYNFAVDGARRVEFSRKLARLYPAGHPITLLAGSADGEFAPNTVPLSRLGPALEKADEAVTILVPARGSR